MHIIVRDLGLSDYEEVFSAMKDFTAQRDKETTDELWLTQHNPVFTQGQAGKKEHILNQGNIPIVQSDRGGQVTYHGPGQLVIYLLIDIKRRKIGVRQMVSLIEDSVIELLARFQITALAKSDAPGVYIDNKKIASLGLRVRNGRTYHGVSLNIDMDLSPFQFINPCGYQGLQMTQLIEQLHDCDFDTIGKQLSDIMITRLEAATISHTG